MNALLSGLNKDMKNFIIVNPATPNKMKDTDEIKFEFYTIS